MRQKSLAAFLFFTGLLFSQIEASERIGTKLPEVNLRDESGKIFKLSDWKGKIFFIHPMFASCKSICPMMTQSLLQSFKEFGDFKEKFRVLSLSFDPKETPKSLAAFRKTHSLPEGWHLASGEDIEVRKVLDAIDFRYVKTDTGDFAHSNTLVLIDENSVIREYLYGASISASQIEGALFQLQGKTNASFQIAVLIGALTIVIGLSLIVFIGWGRKTKNSGHYRGVSTKYSAGKPIDSDSSVCSRD